MKYTSTHYTNAILFALNIYEDTPLSWKYSEEKDLYTVEVLIEGGWHHINLKGSFVRHCLKYKGIKKWKGETNELSMYP